MHAALPGWPVVPPGGSGLSNLSVIPMYIIIPATASCEYAKSRISRAMLTPAGRVARAGNPPGPLRTEQGDFHHSAPPLRSLTELGPRSGHRSGVEGAGAP